eukprot:gene9766-2093_t
MDDQKLKTHVLLPKEQLSKIYDAVDKLKKEGKDLSDPKYEKLVKILKQQIMLIKQKQGIPTENPTSQLKSTPTLIPSSSSVVNSTNLTKPQYDQLRAQIYAFKHHLHKNVDIPPALYPAIRGNNAEKSLREYELLYKPTSQAPGVNSISNSNFGMSSNAQYKPSNSGLDLQTLFYERERRIQLRIKTKFEELKQIITTPSEKTETKINAAVQLKSLTLLRLQKELRTNFVNEYKRIEMEKYNNNPGMRRSKRNVDAKDYNRKMISLPNPRRRVEVDPDTRKRNKHRKYLNEILNQRKKFHLFHKEKQRLVEKLNKELLSYFEKKARVEREKKEKEERARLKALKENDSEAYYEMLVSAKEDRLLQLIKQTDECLSNLGAQLVNERIKQDGNEDEIKDEMGDKPKGVVERFLHNEKAYYTVAHRLTEKIESQPSTLAFGKLKKYQISGLQWLVSLYNNKLNGILADEMGLGKTIQTVSLITYLMEYKSNPGPYLVIVPLSTLENWRIEFERWAPHIKVIKYAGAQSTRKQLEKNEIRNRDFNVLLTQYEYVTKDKRILKKLPWEYIIIDEGHRIKNKDCKLVLDLKQYKSEHRLLLTGTPLQNDLKELWALLNFLLPTIFDNSSNFETWFNSPFKGMDSETSQKLQMTEEENLLIIQRLHQVLRPFLLRREKKDVEDQLPEKVEIVIRCHLSVLQKKLYEQIQNKNSIASDEKGKYRHKSLNNSVMQLRKVCNHPFLFFDDWSSFEPTDIIRTSGKFELLNRMLPKLKSQGHKVLIFSQMTSLLDILGYYLAVKGYQFLRLDGNVKAESREKIFERAQEKRDAEAKVIKAGMFDQSSTSTQRQEMLETILLKTDELVESEVPDDEMLNQMLARGDEFEIFQKYDRDEEEREKEFWSIQNLPVQSRLMVDEKELPEWLTKSFVIKEEKEEEFYYGRGHRKSRNQDSNFVESFEETGNDTNAIIKEEEKDSEFVEKKRKRSSSSVTKEKRKKKKKSIDTPLQKLLISWYEKITMMYEDDTWICSLFMELPSKQVYPDYYKLIQNPICFDDIKEKIEYNEYTSIEEMEKDIELMKKNAFIYNQHDSFVCVFATKILDQFTKLKNENEQKNVKSSLFMEDEDGFSNDFEEEEEEDDIKSNDASEEDDNQSEENFLDIDEEEDPFEDETEELFDQKSNESSSFDIFGGDQSNSIFDQEEELKVVEETNEPNFLNW